MGCSLPPRSGPVRPGRILGPREKERERTTVELATPITFLPEPGWGEYETYARSHLQCVLYGSQTQLLIISIYLHFFDLFVLHVEDYPGEVTGPHPLAVVAPEFARGPHIDVSGIGNLVKSL